MRQSAAANRTSHALNSQVNVAASLAKLAEKKKELEAVSALENASALYLTRLEGLGEDCEIMANAGQIHGQVLEQWPKMFQILSLFLSAQNSTDGKSDTLPDEGQMLVRIPLDDLQQQQEQGAPRSEP